MKFTEVVLKAEEDVQFDACNYDATKLLQAWDTESARTAQLAFYIGRIKQYTGNVTEALDWYKEAEQRKPTYVWVFFERSEIYELAGDIASLCTDLLTFLKMLAEEGSNDQLNTEHHKAILRKSHLVFTRDVLLSRSLYNASWQIGVFDYLSLLRITEGLLDNGRVLEAEVPAQLLLERFKPDAFGLLALSRLAQAQGNVAQAVDDVLKAGEMLPRHFWVRGQVCLRLIELQAYDKAEAAIALFATDPQLEIEEVSVRLPMLNFRLAVLQARVADVLAIVTDIDHVWPGIETWVYAEALYKFARFGQVWTQEETELIVLLHNYLRQQFTTNDSACLAVLHYYAARGEWQTASDLIRTVAHLLIFESRDMVIRRFEVACHLQQLAEAQLIYATRWRNNPSLNLSELTLSMRLLSELKDWPSAAEVAAELVTRGMSLPEDAYGILQIVRRAGQHNRFIDLLQNTGRNDLFALSLLQLLVDDLCVIRGVTDMQLENINQSISYTNEILVKPQEGLGARPLRSAGFICSDQAYFVSVLTLIASLAPNVGRNANWYVFLSADVPAAWSDALRVFCQSLSFDLTIVFEENFFVRSEGCPTDYGLFSGGRNLARSAYFRIYAADWLRKQCRYQRAVYLDSDIICQGDLDGLFSFNIDDAPLAASPEEYGVGVVKAALKCNVAPENYINSGVLMFNFDHPAMTTHLHDAIWQSENAGSRLTFHDQCALNIAFAGAIKHLPKRFNTFLRPFRTYDEELRSGVLLHYLDRPKPWDTGFTSGHRAPWLLAASIVKALLPREIYHDIVAAGIGQVAEYRRSLQAVD